MMKKPKSAKSGILGLPWLNGVAIFGRGSPKTVIFDLFLIYIRSVIFSPVYTKQALPYIESSKKSQNGHFTGIWRFSLQLNAKLYIRAHTAD